MMSVNELFYGNQATTTWIIRTPVAQVKQYGPSHGNQANPRDSSSKHDRDTQQTYSHNYYNPPIDSYTSRFHDSQQQSSKYPSSNYHSSKSYDNGPSGSSKTNHGRSHQGGQQSRDYSYDNSFGSLNPIQAYGRPQQSRDYSYDNSYGFSNSNHGRPQHNADYSSSYNYYPGRGSARGALAWTELRVPVCCEACAERVSCHLLGLRGVESVHCDEYKQKVAVRGNAAPADLLCACRKLFKRSDFWNSSSRAEMD